MKFEERVTDFMVRHGYTASQFGRRAMKDPNFVNRLRKGRQVTERIMDKVDAWMAQESFDASIRRLRALDSSWATISEVMGVPKSKILRRAREIGLLAPPQQKP